MIETNVKKWCEEVITHNTVDNINSLLDTYNKLKCPAQSEVNSHSIAHFLSNRPDNHRINFLVMNDAFEMFIIRILISNGVFVLLHF